MPERDPGNPDRWTYSTKTKYEFQFGYSRAVRHGNVIRVAGTAGLDEDGNPVKGGITDQMRRALDIVKAAIESVAVIHGDFFRDIRPATTIVQVNFIDPRIQVEIEAEVVYGGADAKR